MLKTEKGINELEFNHCPDPLRHLRILHYGAGKKNCEIISKNKKLIYVFNQK